MAYVIQHRAEDGEWEERHERFSNLEAAIKHVHLDSEAQIVRIPAGVIVWSSNAEV